MDHVLVPFDRSPPAERALRHALDRHGGMVTALFGVDPLSPEGCALSDAPLDVGADDLRADGGNPDTSQSVSVLGVASSVGHPPVGK